MNEGVPSLTGEIDQEGLPVTASNQQLGMETRTVGGGGIPFLNILSDALLAMSSPEASQRQQAMRQNRVTEEIERQQREAERTLRLKEAEYEKSKPLIKPNSDGSITLINPLLLPKLGPGQAVVTFGKKQSDPLKFEEEIAKVQKLYDVEFTKEDLARAYVRFQSYINQDKDNRNPKEFFDELNNIIKDGQKRSTEQGLFDNNFDDAKSSLLSLGPFDKEEQAQVGAAIANSQLKKTIQPLQSLATSIAGKRDLAQARQERGGVADTFKQIQRLNQQANQEDKLRGDYEQEIKDLVTVRNQYDRIAVAMKEQTPAADISLVFAYMKMLDPTSVVRESEYATARNAAGVPDRVRNFYNKLVDGVQLTPEQRADFAKQARGLLVESTRHKVEADTKYRGIARNRGLNPDNIIRDLGFDLKQYNIITPTGQVAKGQWRTPEEISELEKKGYKVEPVKGITRNGE